MKTSSPFPRHAWAHTAGCQCLGASSISSSGVTGLQQLVPVGKWVLLGRQVPGSRTGGTALPTTLELPKGLRPPRMCTHMHTLVPLSVELFPVQPSTEGARGGTRSPSAQPLGQTHCGGRAETLHCGSAALQIICVNWGTKPPTISFNDSCN